MKKRNSSWTCAGSPRMSPGPWTRFCSIHSTTPHPSVGYGSASSGGMMRRESDTYKGQRCTERKVNGHVEHHREHGEPRLRIPALERVNAVTERVCAPLAGDERSVDLPP